MKIDVLAFAPHPDDAELYCSGTLLALKHSGYSIGIVDVTRGELSTRGTPEQRDKETTTASAILQLDMRSNLEIPDGNIENNLENRWKVAEVLRQAQPDTVLLPYHTDRHPDHGHASELVHEALFYAGVSKWNPGEEVLAPHRPRRAYYYALADDFDPDILIDITAYFETKMAAIGAYASQFYTGALQPDEPDTYVSTKGFMEALVARSRRLGFLAGGTYAEGLKLIKPASVTPELLMRI